MSNIDLKKCMFIDGGKRINLMPSDDTSKLKFTRNADKSWIVNLEFKIVSQEAESVISVFDDFECTPEELPAKFPNQLYIQVFDQNNNPNTIPCSNISLQLSHDKNETGILQLNLNAGLFGKTQSGKLQSPNVTDNPNLS